MPNTRGARIPASILPAPIARTISAIALAILAFPLVTIFIIVGFFADQRLYPRIYAGPVALGFQSLPQAQKILQARVDRFLSTPITFSYDSAQNGTQAAISPKELGINFAAQQSIKSLPIYQFHKDNPLSLARALIFPQNFPLQFEMDNDHSAAVILQKFNLAAIQPQNASFFLDAHQKLQIAPEQSGLKLNRSKLFTALSANLQNLNSAPITIELARAEPLVTGSMLEARKESFRPLLYQSLTLTYEGRKWKIKPADHLDAIGFKTDISLFIPSVNLTLPFAFPEPNYQGKTNTITSIRTSFEVDEEKLRPFLKTAITEKINKPASDVKISKDANDKIILEGKGQNGLQVAEKNLIASLATALNNRVTQIQIPVSEQKANVTVAPELQNLGIKTLIATGHSAFAGSHPGRVHNINVGISRYNGLLVKPGEIFSFNDHLGPVDGEHGFTQELVIKKEGTIPDFGGGLCQVSSTLYRAALYGGFPIKERAPHKYAVSYYAQIGGYGLDGTIYPGSHDVKFLNDSPAALLIQAYTEGDQAYFKFYGTDDGRKVWLEGPYQANTKLPGPTELVETDKLAPGVKKQVEKNHTGFDVTWYRYIVKDSTQKKETVFSRYEAVPEKILVGIAKKPVPKTTAGKSVGPPVNSSTGPSPPTPSPKIDDFGA